MLPAKNKALINPLVEKLNIKRKSARAYASQIRRIFTDMKVSGPISFRFLDSDKAVKHVAAIDNVGRRKNMATAALAGARAGDMSKARQSQFRDVMFSADKGYKQWIASGTRNKGFSGNAEVLWKQIKDLHKKVGRVVTAKNLFKRSSHTFNELLILQHFAYCKLISQFEPRRLEYSSLRFLTPDKLKVFSDAERKGMNYILMAKRGRWKLVYNSYKTSRTYGAQTFDIPPGLKTTFKKIERIFSTRVPAGWLFFSRNNRALSRSSFSKFVKVLFQTYVGKNWTQNTVRSIRVSALFKDAPPTKELIATQEGMGSNLATLNLNYRVPQK